MVPIFNWHRLFTSILNEVHVILHQPYDILALVPVIEGAGGTITDWSSKPLLWEASSTAVATSTFNVPQNSVSCYECGAIQHLRLCFHWSQALM